MRGRVVGARGRASGRTCGHIQHPAADPDPDDGGLALRRHGERHAVPDDGIRDGYGVVEGDGLAGAEVWRRRRGLVHGAGRGRGGWGRLGVGGRGARGRARVPRILRRRRLWATGVSIGTGRQSSACGWGCEVEKASAPAATAGTGPEGPRAARAVREAEAGGTEAAVAAVATSSGEPEGREALAAGSLLRGLSG